MVDPLNYYSFPPVLHDWYNKGRGMFYLVCGMMHITEPLLLIIFILFYLFILFVCLLIVP